MVKPAILQKIYACIHWGMSELLDNANIWIAKSQVGNILTLFLYKVNAKLKLLKSWTAFCSDLYLYCILVYVGAMIIWKVFKKTYVLGLPLILVFWGHHVYLRLILLAVIQVSSFKICDQNVWWCSKED